MSKILKYKKIIMLALVLVSIITCVCAAYITEYKKTKVTPEILFTEIEETRTYKDSEEFLKNYEYFYIYTERYVEATEDDKGNLMTIPFIGFFKIPDLEKEFIMYSFTDNDINNE